MIKIKEVKKIDWKNSLKNFVSKNKSNIKNKKEIEEETDELFLKYMEDYRQKKIKNEPTLAIIPKFYQPNNSDNQDFNIHNKIKQEARSRFLQHKTAEILDKEDLEKLWEQIKSNTSFPDDGTERINYDSFLKIAKNLPPKCRHFFSASTFLKFDRDEYGRIDIASFFHSIVRKVSLFQTRIQISLYDTIGNGYLKDKDLEIYILELISGFENLKDLSENFKNYYIKSVVKRFFYFLDPKKTGRIYIKDMLTSPILAELYNLRQDQETEELQANWFSLYNINKIYDNFLKLDENKNQLLCKKELINYQWGLTDLFIDRFFEESNTSNGEIDYTAYLDFILTLENRKTPQAIAFFFKCLDFYKNGYIDTFVINMFFKEVLKKLSTKDNEAEKNFHVEDIKDEIFDMAKPENLKIITLNDLINCGQGDIIISILIDAKAFYDYDQRELVNNINLDDDTQFDIAQNINKDVAFQDHMPQTQILPNSDINTIEPIKNDIKNNFGKFNEI